MEMNIIGLQMGAGHAAGSEHASAGAVGSSRSQGQPETSFNQMLVQVIGTNVPGQATASTAEMPQGLLAMANLHSLYAGQDEQLDFEALLAALKRLAQDQDSWNELIAHVPELAPLLTQAVQIIEGFYAAPEGSTSALTGQASVPNAQLAPIVQELTAALQQTSESMGRMTTFQEALTRSEDKSTLLLQGLRSFIQLHEQEVKGDGRIASAIPTGSQASSLDGRTSLPLHFNTSMINMVKPLIHVQTEQAMSQSTSAPADSLIHSSLLTGSMKHQAMSPISTVFAQTEMPDSEHSAVPERAATETIESASLATARTVGELQLKSQSMTMPAQRFSGEMSEFILKTMRFSQGDGISEARITLIPERLGQVEVKLTMQNGQLIAQFAADTLAGKEALESQLPQLRAALQTQGIQVEKLEVSQNLAGLSHQMNDQRNPQFTRQFEHQPKNKTASYDLSAIEFEDELNDTMEAMRSVYGNSFEVTA